MYHCIIYLQEHGDLLWFYINFYTLWDMNTDKQCTKKNCSPAACVFIYHIGIWNTTLLNSDQV